MSTTSADATPFIIMACKGMGTSTLAARTSNVKAEPGKYNYGEGSVPARLATELYLQLLGAKVVHVGYRGNEAGFPDLVNGRIAFMVVDVVGAKPLVDRGEVDALAVSFP